MVYNNNYDVVFLFFVRAKFGQLGPSKGQFNSPHGFCMGLDEDIVVADTNNHRVQVFDKSGDFKYQFGIPGILAAAADTSNLIYITTLIRTVGCVLYVRVVGLLPLAALECLYIMIS